MLYPEMKVLVENELSYLQDYINNNPEQGELRISCDDSGNRYFIVTNITPEHLANIANANLCWCANVYGTSRRCFIRYIFDEITYFDVTLICALNNGLTCEDWPMP